MPRFYFHLSAPDQDFPDDIGSDVGDLATAHSIAVRLMKRVMQYCPVNLRGLGQKANSGGAFRVTWVSPT